MKTYHKAELIAKNLPTGSYAAGCPTNGATNGIGWMAANDTQYRYGNRWQVCNSCEIAQ